MKVALYTRVSTDVQAEEGYSIGEQKDRLENYCKAKGWHIYSTYTDAGESGAKLDRPELNRMLEGAKNKLFDLVLVYKLDRLSRSQKDTLYIIEDVLLPNDVGFASMSENFDTTTPFGKAIIGILSVFAQLEREQIKERMSMGRIARVKTGKHMGGNNISRGYKWIDGEIIVDDYIANIVRYVFKMYDKGVPITQIASNVNTLYTVSYDASSISRMLTNVAYIGKLSFKGETYDDVFEPIIDKELFDRVNKRYNDNSKNHKYIRFNALLSGLLYCKRCGDKYYHRHNSGCKYKKEIYLCHTRSHKGDKDKCKNKIWKCEELETKILNEIKQLKFNESFITTQKQIDDSLNSNTILNKIKQIDIQIDKLLDLYSLGTIDVDKLNNKIKQLNEDKVKLNTQLDNVCSIKPKNITTILEAMDDIINNGDIYEKREFIKSLINKIELDGDDIYIHWTF